MLEKWKCAVDDKKVFGTLEMSDTSRQIDNVCNLAYTHKLISTIHELQSHFRFANHMTFITRRNKFE